MRAALDGTKCFNSEGVVQIRHGAVSPADIALALDAASAVLVPAGSRIQHVIVRAFSVDGGPAIQDPEGIRGMELRVRVHLVTAPSAAVEEARRLVQASGLQVDDLVVEPFALITFAEVTLAAEEKQEGIVVIQVGERAAGVVIFTSGSVAHSAVICSASESEGDLAAIFRAVRREIWASNCAPFLRSGVTIMSSGPLPDGTEEMCYRVLELPARFRPARGCSA